MKPSLDTLIPTFLGLVAIIAIIFFIRSIEAEKDMNVKGMVEKGMTDKSIANNATAVPALTKTSSVETDNSSPYIEFPDLDLAKGREIWLGTCEGCHAYGTAGAPIPMEKDAWQSRILKGKPLLYEHAINGFFGPDDTMMPERGGNPKLTDDEVKAAVDYMIALAEYYIEN